MFLIHHGSIYIRTALLGTYPREEEVVRSYEEGQKMAQKYNRDLTAAVHGEDVDYIFNDDLRGASWEAGFNDDPKFVWAEGWRLGDVPKSGRSYNYRDNHPEPGVSMMEVRDEYGNKYSTEDALSAAFISRRDKRVEYSGWLVGFGSDGEPCLLR